MQEEENKPAGTPAKFKAPVSPLKSLEKDLKYYEESIKEIAAEILANKISKFPIFIAHQHEVSLGEVILDRHELGTDWSIHVSTMEELIEVKLILEEKKEFFELNFKDPTKFMCLFVIVPEGANFAFHPYH